MRIQRNGNRVTTRQRGSALLASLVVVLVVSSMGAVLIQMHASITRRTAHAVDTKRALYVAEAGLSEAFLAVAQGKSGNVGSVDEPAIYGDGVFWVEATEESDERVTLNSTGLVGAGRFAVSVVLQRQFNDLGVLGVFAEDGVTIKTGAVVDGFDADEADFDTAVSERTQQTVGVDSGPADSTQAGARVGSNGDIVVEGVLGARGEESTFVYGDIMPGPGGAVTVEPGVHVSGTTTPSLQNFTLPAFSLPTDLPTGGDVTLDDPDNMRVVEGMKARYDKFVVKSGTSLSLRGPATIVAEQFIVETGAKLYFDTTGGGISVYVTDYLDWQADSTVFSPSEDSASVTLLIDDCPVIDRDGDSRVDQPVNLDCRGTLNGLIYAPYNRVVLPSTLRVFGAIVSKELTLGSNARITFDASVTKGAVAMESLPKLLSWRLIDLPDEQIVKVGLDPRTTLTMQGITPVPSADAHRERDLTLDYLDTTGMIKTYSGPVSAFNWNDLDSVIDADWIDPDTALPIAADKPNDRIPALSSMPPTAIKAKDLSLISF